MRNETEQDAESCAKRGEPQEVASSGGNCCSASYSEAVGLLALKAKRMSGWPCRPEDGPKARPQGRAAKPP